MVTFTDSSGALAAGISIPALSLLVVALRFLVRRYQGHRYGADDWLTIPALVLVAGMGAALVAGEFLGPMQYDRWAAEAFPSGGPPTAIDKSAAPVSGTTPTSAADKQEAYISTFESTAKCLWAFYLLMYLMLALTKLSILFFYRRIFWQAAHPLLCAATLAVSVLIALWATIFFFLGIFGCGQAVDLNWSPLSTHTALCFTDIRPERPFAASDFVFNIAILLLPLPTIHALKLSFRRRVAVGLVLLLGSAATAASLARLILVEELGGIRGNASNSSQHSERLLAREYISYWITTMYWCTIEAGIALQAACLPVLCSLLPGRVLGHGEGANNRTGTLATQVGDDYHHGAAAAGRRAGIYNAEMGLSMDGTADGTVRGIVGRNGDLRSMAADDRRRESGWFARFREAAVAVNPASRNAAAVNSSTSSRDSTARISVLDLNGEDEEKRGRTRFRQGEETTTTETTTMTMMAVAAVAGSLR